MASAWCPRCGTESHRVHAWHLRRLADLPVGGCSAVMELRVRRLLCTEMEYARSGPSVSRSPLWPADTHAARYGWQPRSGRSRSPWPDEPASHCWVRSV
ncbi:transposase family protein [Pseudonocardia sp. ICBG1293]|uniref:transposase family protein n=1 Tax=Pseudonocardia sp. ICBG1293 TaxID=2844382 RepID=UPI001CCBB364